MTKINKEKAAETIENQIINALEIKFNEFNSHPIRLIQASKSLIGLNLEQPNSDLLYFNDFYIKKNKNNLIKKSESIDLKANEVITVHDIEQALINCDREVALCMLNQLSLVSSDLHILECLIEISLKQTGKSFLVIWSLYRSIFFLNKEVNNSFLSLSIDVILSDNFEDLIHIDSDCDINIIAYEGFSNDFLDLYAHLLEAYNSDLIRELKIKSLIKNMIFRKSNHFNLNKFKDKNSIDYPDLLSSGRFWLSEFLSKIDKQKFTMELILFLDSIRCLFRFLDFKNHKFICLYFQRTIKDFNV